jgi:hypothetical protein
LFADDLTEAKDLLLHSPGGDPARINQLGDGLPVQRRLVLPHQEAALRLRPAEDELGRQKFRSSIHKSPGATVGWISATKASSWGMGIRAEQDIGDQQGPGVEHHQRLPGQRAGAGRAQHLEPLLGLG